MGGRVHDDGDGNGGRTVVVVVMVVVVFCEWGLYAQHSTQLHGQLN